MRSAFLVGLLAFFSVSLLQAQDDRLDDLSFDEAPLKDEVIPYFAIGVGPVFNFAFADLKEVNARGAQLGLGEIKSPVFQIGAELFTAIGLISNVRLGFSWVSGSSTTSADVSVNNVAVNRTLLYGISSRTVHIDYAWVPVKSLAILPGVGLGWGDQRLETYQSQKQLNWADLADSTNFAPSPNAYTALKQSTLYVLPRLNIEYAVTPFLNLRANASYTVQVSQGDWKANNYATVADVPSSISVSGLNLQFGVFVGLFN